jgi:hypothetical protein
MRFLVLDKTTKAVINPNYIAAPDIQQWINDVLSNLDASLELVCEYEPYSYPPVEERLITVTTVEAYENTAHPTYPQVNQWLKTYVVTDKPVEDKKLAVDIVENQNNESTIPYEKRLKYTILALDATLDYLGLTNADAINLTSLNNKKKKRLKVFKRVANKINQNDNERDAKYTLIDDAINPDLDANWQSNDFTEEI